MYRPAIALAALCLAAAAAQAHAHRTTTYTTDGPALRTTHAGLPRWADAPSGYTLGEYTVPRATLHGTSAARTQHIDRLRTCNPFAGVRYDRPLAPCD